MALAKRTSRMKRNTPRIGVDRNPALSPEQRHCLEIVSLVHPSKLFENIDWNAVSAHCLRGPARVLNPKPVPKRNFLKTRRFPHPLQGVGASK